MSNGCEETERESTISKAERAHKMAKAKVDLRFRFEFNLNTIQMADWNTSMKGALVVKA